MMGGRRTDFDTELIPFQSQPVFRPSSVCPSVTFLVIVSFVVAILNITGAYVTDVDGARQRFMSKVQGQLLFF